MEIFRRFFGKKKTDAPSSPYDGDNAIAEHDFFTEGSVLHGGENSKKITEFRAGDIHARMDKQDDAVRNAAAQEEKRKRQAAEKEAYITAQKEAQLLLRKKEEQERKDSIGLEQARAAIASHAAEKEKAAILPKPAVESPTLTLVVDNTKPKKEYAKNPHATENMLAEEAFFGMAKKNEKRTELYAGDIGGKDIAPESTPEETKKAA